MDLARQRNGAQTDDWVHAVLDYDRLRVLLHASVLAAEPGPRFVLHGTAGSDVKLGLDTQEEALKAAVSPGALGWGCDPLPGTLTLAGPQGPLSMPYPGLPGDYRCYYAGVRDAPCWGRRHRSRRPRGWRWCA